MTGDASYFGSWLTLRSPLAHLKSIYVKLNFCVWIFVRATSHCGLSCRSWLHIIRSYPECRHFARRR